RSGFARGKDSHEFLRPGHWTASAWRTWMVLAATNGTATPTEGRAVMRHRILAFLQGGRRRRRLLVLGVVASVAALGVFMITNAFAVHDEKFELDGNVTTEGHTAFNTGTVDWASF